MLRFGHSYGILSRSFQILTYALTMVLGILTVLYPLPAIAGVIGISLTYLYGWMLGISGVLALYAVLRPNFKIEITFLFPVIAGWIVYDLSVWAVYVDRIYHPTDQAPPYGSGIAGALVCLFFVWRCTWLIGEARKLAKEVDRARLFSDE